MIFVDESIQHSLGYICVGFAYCEESLDEHISSALLRAGLVPRKDEYKSGVRMNNSEARHILRKDIAAIVLEHCKLAVYIAPVEDRENLLEGIVAAARDLVVENKLTRPQSIFVDQGIHGSVSPDDSILVAADCDSRSVLGIQLADYVAYHCSYLLKCELEGSSKSVLVEMPCHPKEDEQAELNWLLRTEIRRNFFVEHRDIEEIQGDDWTFRAQGFGAFYANTLNADLAKAARMTFDEMYFGCVW